MLSYMMYCFMAIILFSMSCSSFWSLWIISEVFTFLMIPYISKGESKSSKLMTFLYFMVQSLCSIFFLFSSIFAEYTYVLISVSMFVKLAMFPFHFWFVKLIQELSWNKLTFLLTLGKFIPLIMLLHFSYHNLMWLCITGLMIPLGGFTTSNIRCIIGYSSIVNSSWLALGSALGLKFLSMFAFLYFLPLFFFCKLMSFFEKGSLKSMLKESNWLTMTVFILSMTGFPPLPGFLSKLVLIYGMESMSSLVELTLMGILSCLPLFFYLKMMMFVFMEFSLNSSYKFYTKSNDWKLLFIMIISSLFYSLTLW